MTWRPDLSIVVSRGPIVRAFSLCLSVPLVRWPRAPRSQCRGRRVKLDRVSASVSVAATELATVLGGMSPRETSLLGALVVDYALQLVGWAIASLLRTDKTYDMFGSLTFFSISLGTLLFGGIACWRQVMVSAFVCLWALRLGSFLVLRVFKTGGDSRFDQVKDKPGLFLVYWLVQGAWVFITLLPLLALNSGPGGAAALSWSDVAGGLLWATGLGVETVADAQKFAFKMDARNKGRYINTGLWRYAKYPNYGGEMLVWWGVFLASTPAFESPWWYCSVASPLFVMFILTSLSGIPLQEKQAQQRWGAEASYQEYRRTTRLLFPIPKFSSTSSNVS